MHNRRDVKIQELSTNRNIDIFLHGHTTEKPAERSATDHCKDVDSCLLESKRSVWVRSIFKGIPSECASWLESLNLYIFICRLCLVAVPILCNRSDRISARSHAGVLFTSEKQKKGFGPWRTVHLGLLYWHYSWRHCLGQMSAPTAGFSRLLNVGFWLT